MRPSLPCRRLPPSALLTVALLLAAVYAPGARAATMRLAKGTIAAPAAMLEPCAPLASRPPDQPPVLRDRVGLNYPDEALEAGADDTLEVCVLVDSTGTVREARPSRARSPYDSAVVDAARWCVFEPARSGGRAVPSRVAVTFEARLPRDTDPLVPDVIAIAREAEARGNLLEALDAWTGVLARAGTYPAIQNEWAIREHVMRLVARLPQPVPVPPPAVSRARSTHSLMLRNVARGANADYAQALDEVLLEAPWYADAYRWRASARAACGQRDGAVRDVLCYRIAAPDSAAHALAERALVALAAADTVAALTMLKN